MTDDELTVLLRYLQASRAALLWKLDGLSERDARLPLTPTGTNLLGLVKHATGVELGYFGDVFGRPMGLAHPVNDEDAEDNADMWATADEPMTEIVDAYRRVWVLADASIRELGLDAQGNVAWWPAERNPVSMRQIVVHVTYDLARHAGHADIVRELIDGSAGLRADNANLPGQDAAWWHGYVERLQGVADAFGPDGSASR